MAIDRYEYVREFLRNEAGIVLDSGKDYLIEARLGPVVKAEGYESIEAFIKALKGSRQGDAHRKLVEALTTHETSFFRDFDPFEVLRHKVLPDLIAARRDTRELRIWYAASSTGQEPYSVSILLREYFPELSSWKITQVATDLSRPVLARAREGRYSQLEVNRGMPAPLLLKYFRKHGLEWQSNEDIRSMVRFQELNLNAKWPAMGPFDMVFIRNVMIYFDVPAKQTILRRIHDLLPSDGYLFLGAVESTINLDDRFARAPYERSGCYRRAAAAAA